MTVIGCPIREEEQKGMKNSTIKKIEKRKFLTSHWIPSKDHSLVKKEVSQKFKHDVLSTKW